MPVIAIASSKGGSGKSTTAIVLAGEYARVGYRVHIVDADKKPRVFNWAKAGNIPAEITVSTANESNLRQEVEIASRMADVVLIDVEGTANAALALAIGYADGVVITCSQAGWDVEDAFQTAHLIRDMEGVSRRKIPHGVVWTKTALAIRSREYAALEQQVAEGGIKTIGRLPDRTAFRSIVTFATTLHGLADADVPTLDKAKADALTLAEAVTAFLTNDGSKSKEIAA